MTNISAAMVKELRDKTGAGMMDCKSALTETNGDIEAAVDWLRTKGLAKAAKKAGRIAAEGLVGLAVGETEAAVVEINSETDFVARNDQFQILVSEIAKVALAAPADVEALSSAAYPAGGTVSSAIAEAVATIGENMTLRRVEKLTVTQGAFGFYVHNAVSADKANLGRIGVIVALESAGKKDELTALGRQIAMHVAAANPLALESSQLSADVIERERAVLLEKARASGKPEAVVEKIVEGGLKTYYKEVCLVDQAFIHEPSKTVAQAVKESEGKVGAPIKLAGFVRYALGEGVEKTESDFAAEVAAAAGQR
ncbi:elongation factor Ts [Agaricicola taiwanensis]|uniref:Elongation factor Ts n=1 Tax=Agaricicola taiwanensis TaxID=591372 RepID=A0A8J2YI40_9RHOB|nr:translation elongation factor Ts [Agaricicola taiwanensis]GGE44317.1 elongation factor Ts [Agaricicola taiwanensis]